MGGLIVCLAATLLVVDARCRALPDGGVQYVIQIEPQLLERLESGAIEAVASHVPREINDIRAYQITIGTQKLAENAPTADSLTRISADDETQWVPLPTDGVECRVWIKPEILDEFQKPGRVIEGRIPDDVEKPSLFTIAVGTKPSAASLPIVTEPAATDSAVTEPVAIDPVLTEPVDTQPPLPEPEAVAGTSEPAITKIEPSQPPLEPTPSGSSAEPCVMEPPTDSKRISMVKPANHIEQPETKPDEQPQAKADSNSPAKDQSAAPPEWPLWATLALLGLFASLAGNMFLLWILHDFRTRYRELLRRMEKVGQFGGTS